MRFGFSKAWQFGRLSRFGPTLAPTLAYPERTLRNWSWLCRSCCSWSSIGTPLLWEARSSRWSTCTWTCPINSTSRAGILRRAADNFRSRRCGAAGYPGVVLPLYVPREASVTGPRVADLERSYLRISQALLRTPPFSAAGCGAKPGAVRTFYAFEGAGPAADDPEVSNALGTARPAHRRPGPHLRQ